MKIALQTAAVLAITLSQALLNHLGIRVTTRLTDFSGYWILLVSLLLTAALLICAPALDFSRLVTFTNYSGPRGNGVWPETASMTWLFALGFLLPAYTVSGFDASAHVSEETIGAALRVPRSIVRSVLVSGLAGWVMLSAVVLAIPVLDEAARQGDKSFYWTMNNVLPRPLAIGLFVGIAVAQYLCGLATVTSASRMAYGFARDGGLPFSASFRRVSPRRRTPSFAIWTLSIAAVLFTVYTEAYTTIAAACAIFLYISYVLPTALGLLAYGRSWTNMGPWDIGRSYRPLALLCVVGCGILIAIGIAPPNDSNAWVVGGMTALLAAGWFGYARSRFRGPPTGMLAKHTSGAPEPPSEVGPQESIRSSAAKATSHDDRDDEYVSHH
jgi:amino acid transporter